MDWIFSKEFAIVLGVIIYLAIVHSTHVFLNLYSFKELLNHKTSTTTNARFISLVEDGYKTMENGKAEYVFLAYIWPLTIIIFIFISTLEYIKKVFSIFILSKEK